MSTARRSARSRSRGPSFIVRAGSASGERVRLSVLDLLTGTFATSRVFFYRTALDGAALRASLARTLAHYPLLTGRLARDADGGLSVVCNDAGAVFVEADADAPLPDYDYDSTVDKRLLRNVNPFMAVGHDEPVLTVKLTRMGGGCALGVGINHSVVDGTAYMTFMQHWAAEHLGLEHPAPCHDRAVLDSLASLARPGAEEHSDQYAVVGRRQKLAFLWRVNKGATGMRTVGMRFTAGEIGAIKENAQAGLAGTGKWVSSADALTAHLWQVAAELRDRPADSRERLGIVIGARAALKGDLPEAYWGNVVTNVRPGMAAGELRAAPLSTVATVLRESLDGVTGAVMHDEIGFLESQRRAGRVKGVMSRMALEAFDSTVAVNNLGRLPVYRIDFGTGRPFWCQYPPNLIPWTFRINATPDDDAGRDVQLTLPREVAKAFDDPHWDRRLHAYAEPS
ncbi:acyltransferase [Streptantibioticus silvisoli]|uniref:Acyltransferase n=1 Tax=Streptantibioticus silvisoli TaxID=2705255 RepID=A0ABT6W036_9ACTN|nr:acyltransferase [Streptantibioticus silvisoli]MDI5963745.1 acyltransferase [Streptantibioticus silvisoli]